MAQLATIIPSVPPPGTTHGEFSQRLLLVQTVADHIIYGPSDYVDRLDALNKEFSIAPAPAEYEPYQRLAA